MTTELNVALIGAGAIAREQHLPAWAKLSRVRVVAAADSDSSSLGAIPEEFGVQRQVIDYRELLDDPTIDAVDICVPSALHAEVIVAALSAGKHVLCEKPMATSRADAAGILDAWNISGKRLMIAQHMRFEPSVTRLKNYLAQHPLGNIYFSRAQWLRRRRLPGRPGFFRKELSGGGPLYDLGVHLIDLAWWLAGCPLPQSVHGVTFNNLARRGDLESEWGTWDPATIDVEDFAAGLIRFANGSVLSLEVSWLAFQPEEEFWRLQILGDQAGVVWPEMKLSGENHGVPWDTQLASIQGEKAHHLAIRHFAEAVLDDKEILVDPRQSANTIAILDALYQSAATGRDAIVKSFPLEG